MTPSLEASVEINTTGLQQPSLPEKPQICYQQQQSGVIVSNFKEIRLYNSERGINFYQKFSIFDLLNENEFRKFYFIFNKNNLKEEIKIIENSFKIL